MFSLIRSIPFWGLKDRYYFVEKADNMSYKKRSYSHLEFSFFMTAKSNEAGGHSYFPVIMNGCVT